MFIVQDAYLKFMHVEETIENKKAYLIRTVINLSINFKNRQKKLLFEYPGAWLPEPVATEKADAEINNKETLSHLMVGISLSYCKLPALQWRLNLAD